MEVTKVTATLGLESAAPLLANDRTVGAEAEISVYQVSNAI
jgi:hypothetical protein